MNASARTALILLAVGTLVAGGFAGVHPVPTAAVPPSGPVAPFGASGPSAAGSGTIGLNGSGTSLPGWANISSSTGTPPPDRSYGRSFAYDPVDGYDVLFGGYGETGSYLSDTWTFHAGKWTQLTPTTHPSARDHSTLAWDPVDGYLLLFGGSGNGGAYSDTWTFLAGQWTQLSPHTHPSARWASSMTWDAADQEIVLFGGCVAGTAAGDTWTFLHGNWTQLSPHPAPSGRENVALQFDPRDNYTVLFGGDDYYSAMDGDTWAFSAGNWTQLHPTHSPAARSEAGFAYDPHIGALVLFGGSGATNFGDTWWFAGGNWTEQNPLQSPAPRVFPILTDDPADSELVLFAGVGIQSYDDTWIYYSLNLTASESASAGTAPLQVAYSANITGSLGTVAYSWNLGDGNLSSNATPNETYSTPGLYFPTLTVVDADGSTAFASLEVQVRAPLSTTAAGGPSSGTAPVTVEYSAQSSGGVAPYSYAWTSTAGNSSNSSSATFTFEVPGSYTVSLIAADSAGSSSFRNFSITVAAPVVPPLSEILFGAPSTGEAPLPVEFQSIASGGVAPYSYAWNFGDGSTATGATANHTYSTGGTFTANVTVTDANGHSARQSKTIDVTSALSVSATVTPASGVAPLGVDFTATPQGGASPYAYSWTLGDGSTSGSAAFNHTYLTAGTEEISLTVTDANGRQAQWNGSVDVTAATPVTVPPATTTPSPSGAASGEIITVVAEIVIGAVAIAAIIAYVTRTRR